MRTNLKVLIIGNGDSVWIKNYIENVLLSNNAISCLYSGKIINADYLNFYQSHNVILYGPINNSFIQKIPKVRVFLNIIYALFHIFKNSPYDAIHVHYADILSCRIAYLCRKLTRKEICSFWGSDLFRSSDRQIKKLKVYLNKCNTITVATEKMYNRIKSIFSHIYDNKIKTIRFGIEAFDMIENIKNLEDQKTSRATLGLPTEKIILTIGYSASPNQQHLLIMEQLARINPEILDRVFIVIQMTYGNSDTHYQEEVRKKIKSITDNFIIFDRFMQGEDIARLRVSTDIFIHGQTTDALSASFQEYIYAGAIVLNGKWLKYKELEERGIKYIEYEFFDEIPSLLTNIISSLQNYRLSLFNNRNILRQFSSVQAVSREWYNLYVS